ncbi:hypothetical protein DsansV1_C07g0072291 [Dioscorea sansibarensis]
MICSFSAHWMQYVLFGFCRCFHFLLFDSSSVFRKLISRFCISLLVCVFNCCFCCVLYMRCYFYPFLCASIWCSNIVHMFMLFY